MEDKEFILKNAIDQVRDQYDFIIIDCPPSLNMLTINAMTTADTVLVPIQCEYYALEGLSQLMHTIELVQERLNPELEMEGVVFTMYDARTNLSLQVVENVKDSLDQNIYKTIIPRNVRLAEAPSYGMPINYYDKRSTGAESYRLLAAEVISEEPFEAVTEEHLEKAEKITVVDNLSVATAEITNIVYYYPLINGVGNFLKRPVVKIAEFADSSRIIEAGVREFFETYKDTVYANGTVAKLGIYCGTIEKLEELVYPLVAKIAAECGFGSDTILKFHKGNKQYPQPADSQMQFDSLDKAISKIRVVLLVQIGKEGWDCRSLTGIILSQEGDCTLDAMCEVMNEIKKDELDHVTIKNEVLRKYFPKSYTPKQMQDTIIRLLEKWQRSKQRDMER